MNSIAIFPSWISLILSLAIAKEEYVTGSPEECRLEFTEGHVFVDNQIWLTLGRACVRHGGQEVCVKKTPLDKQTFGSDPLGEFTEYYSVLDVGKGKWKVSGQSYAEDPTTLFFTQNFLDDLKDTAFPASTVLEAASNGMASWFPAFHINKNPLKGYPRGYLEINGMFMGAEGYTIASVDELDKKDALQSGPMALFSEMCVLLMSTASEFMSSSAMFRGDEWGFGFGVMGSISHIPKGHRMSTIISSSKLDGAPDGIRRAFSVWGDKLMRVFNTNRPSDVTLHYLQWSTDNGAYYYYNTEPNKNYEETVVSVKEYAEKVGLPFRNWLMDSWWYYKGADGGVKNWTAMPHIFPDGISYIRKETNWDIVAHNRWWSSETDYAKQNGGDYEFAIEGRKALPLQEEFWDDLFRKAKQWGLTVYEQDWLNVQTQSMNLTLQNVEAAQTWLVQMGNAATRNGLSIQYCMSWPRHVLQSLEVDAVTQSRASGDYQPGNDEWIGLGITSMFSFALGIAPLKDNFWSSDAPQEHCRYDHCCEPAAQLQAIVATYSRGSVSPSDDMVFMDVDLISKSCAEDGKLLRPDYPAVRTDFTILSQAGLPVSSEQRGQVWSTVSDLSGYKYTYMLAADSPAFTLAEQDLYPSSKNNTGYVAWNLAAPFEPLKLPHPVPLSNKTNIHVYCIAPIFTNGWAFLGEAETKWTAVSGDRFSRLDVLSNGFSVSLVGAPEEDVQMVIRTPFHEFIRISCTLSLSGTATFHSEEMDCLHSDPALSTA